MQIKEENYSWTQKQLLFQLLPHYLPLLSVDLSISE